MDGGLDHRIYSICRFTTQKYFIHFSSSYTECLLKRFETMRWLPARDKFFASFFRFCHLLYGGVRLFFPLGPSLFCFVSLFFVCFGSFFGLHSANDFYAIRFDSKAKVRMSLPGFFSSSSSSSSSSSFFIPLYTILLLLLLLAHSQYRTRTRHKIIYDFQTQSF